MTTRAEMATPRWLAEHLAAVPHVVVRSPADVPARDRELAHVAQGYLARRALWAAYGTTDDCRGVVRAELMARGCAEPDALLRRVAEHVYGRAA